MLLDVPDAGTPGMMQCCHGGCDNCAYSSIFDELSSGRAKWVATYKYRQHCDGRDHRPPWLEIFAEKSQINRDEFRDRVTQLPVRLTMGPPSIVATEIPTEETINFIWQRLSFGENVNAEQMEEALQSLSGARNGITWDEFACIFS